MGIPGNKWISLRKLVNLLIWGSLTSRECRWQQPGFPGEMRFLKVWLFENRRVRLGNPRAILLERRTRQTDIVEPYEVFPAALRQKN